MLLTVVPLRKPQTFEHIVYRVIRGAIGPFTRILHLDIAVSCFFQSSNTNKCMHWSIPILCCESTSMRNLSHLYNQGVSIFHSENQIVVLETVCAADGSILLPPQSVPFPLTPVAVWAQAQQNQTHAVNGQSLCCAVNL